MRKLDNESDYFNMIFKEIDEDDSEEEEKLAKDWLKIFNKTSFKLSHKTLNNAQF